MLRPVGALLTCGTNPDNEVCMVGAILDFIRFVFDGDARRTARNLRDIAYRSGGDWKRDIKVARGKFSGNEPYKVAALANYLFDDIAKVGVSPEQVKACRIIFSELVRNAFVHGCAGRPKGKVKIQCTYSPWFIFIEVTDSGKGFDLFKAPYTYPNDSAHSRTHGLHVVARLASSLYTNDAGNAVTAILWGHALPEAEVRKMVYEGYDILRIGVMHHTHSWTYETADWNPIVRAAESSDAPLVLIDDSDDQDVPGTQHIDTVIDLLETLSVSPLINVSELSWLVDDGDHDTPSARCGDAFIAAMTNVAPDPARFYAFVTTRTADALYGLAKLRSPNVRVFSDVIEACTWLILCARTDREKEPNVNTDTDHNESAGEKAPKTVTGSRRHLSSAPYQDRILDLERAARAEHFIRSVQPEDAAKHGIWGLSEKEVAKRTTADLIMHCVRQTEFHELILSKMGGDQVGVTRARNAINSLGAAMDRADLADALMEITGRINGLLDDPVALTEVLACDCTRTAIRERLAIVDRILLYPGVLATPPSATREVMARLAERHSLFESANESALAEPFYNVHFHIQTYETVRALAERTNPTECTAWFNNSAWKQREVSTNPTERLKRLIEDFYRFALNEL